MHVVQQQRAGRLVRAFWPVNQQKVRCRSHEMGLQRLLTIKTAAGMTAGLEPVLQAAALLRVMIQKRKVHDGSMPEV